MNACEDFFCLIVNSLVTSATMSTLGMEDVSEWPKEVPEGLWIEEKEMRAIEMDRILTHVTNSFVKIRYNSTICNRDPADSIYHYTEQLLTIGSIYLEMSDAVREGDGERLIRTWRYLLIIFRNSNRRNYAKDAVLLLHQYMYELSPQQSEQLLFNRFVNTHGGIGRNISADLHMEHLNKIVKDGISRMSSSKSEKAIIRLSKAIGTLSPVLDKFDEANHIRDYRGRKKKVKFEKDLQIVVTELIKNDAFLNIPGRKYVSSLNPKSLLHKTDKTELIQWIITHI